jgi:DNA gyrase subunit A
VRDENDSLGIFAVNGNSKRVAASEFITQKRGGKGVICYKGDSEVADAALLNDEDTILIVGLSKSICISAKDISILGRNAAGVIAIKDRIQSVSKV